MTAFHLPLTDVRKPLTVEACCDVETEVRDAIGEAIRCRSLPIKVEATLAKANFAPLRIEGEQEVFRYSRTRIEKRTRFWEALLVPSESRWTNAGFLCTYDVGER